MRRLCAIGLFLSLGLCLSPAVSTAAQTCAGDLRGECLVRPHILATGAHTYVRGIHWRTWNRSTALGFGRLVEAGGAFYPGFVSPAKIRLSLPADCDGYTWFWSTTINFGREFGRRYLHNYEYTPC